MIDEIEGIQPISKKDKKRIWPEPEPQLPPSASYTGVVLPHHFHRLILKSASQVVDATSENNYRNRAEMRQWRLEDEKIDVWRRLEAGRNYNSLLNRMVAIIQQS